MVFSTETRLSTFLKCQEFIVESHKNNQEFVSVEVSTALNTDIDQENTLKVLLRNSQLLTALNSSQKLGQDPYNKKANF